LFYTKLNKSILPLIKQLGGNKRHLQQHKYLLNPKIHWATLFNNKC